MRLRDQWKQFKADPPGRRFSMHAERGRQTGSRARALASVIVGVVLIAAGLVMLVMPGPGILVCVFGLALIAGHSMWLAKLLDRAEVFVRPRAAAVKRWWKARSFAAKAAIVSFAALVAGSAGLVTVATLVD